MDTHELGRLADERAALLTTYRKDGRPVATAVSIVVEGGHAYFRTYDASGKAKRLRRNKHVLVAPATMTGKAKGPALDGTAQLLDGGEAEHARELLQRKHRILHGILVPFTHRLRGYTTLHYRLTPSSD